MRKIFAPFLAAVLLLCACFNAQKEVVSRVNGRPIYLADFREQLEKNWMAKADNLKQLEYQVKLRCLDDMIKQELILQEARRMGIVVSDDELKTEVSKMVNPESPQFKASLEESGITGQVWREQVRKDMVMKKTIDTALKYQYAVSEQELKNYFTGHPAEFVEPDQYKVRQIMVASEDKAKTVMGELAAGGNFEELARKYSESPEAGNGGDLGWVEPGQLPPELQEVILKMQPGQVSQLNKSPFGYHILKLEAEKKSAAMTYDEARPEILRLFEEQKQNKLYQSWIESLWKKARIKINYQVL